MNYLIDYDTATVECKSEDVAPLEKYVADNDLGLAVAIISEEDDLAMEMSKTEINRLFNNLSDVERKFGTESEAADITYAMLNSRAGQFPTFTPALGKKLLKAAQKRSADTGKGTGKPVPAKAPAKPKAKPVATESAPVKRKRKKSYVGSTFTSGLEEPMRGRHTRIVAFIEDNMGEATGEELEAFLESEGTTPAEHISFAIRKGYIVEVEDEL